MSANTIFILGAGATRAISKNPDFPSPLAIDFFKDIYLKKFMVSDSIAKFSTTQLSKFIKHYFGSKEEVNIEAVYSFFEFAENSFYESFSEKVNLQRAKFELLEYLFFLLYYEIEINPKYYNNIIRKFNEGDSIISFNWDLSIEQILSTSKKGQTLLNSLKDVVNPIFTFDNADYDELAYNNLHRGYFLKMHGSLNWGICDNKDCLRHQIPFIYNINKESHPAFWSCNYCGNKISVMLMPPHVHKNFQANRIFNLQARIAYNKLRTAKKIVIIGYSFPEFDFQVNSLFRKAKLEPADGSSELFLQELHLVDPAISNRNFIKKISDIFGLERAKNSYGHKIEFYKYKNIDLFMKGNY